MAIETIIFDVGGTLVDFPDLFKYFSSLFPDDEGERVQACLRKRVMSDYANVGSGLSPFCTIQEMMETALREVSELLGVADISSSCRDHLYHIGLDLTVPYTDAVPMLARLRDLEITLVVASDADTPLLHLQLEKLGLTSYFSDCVVSGDLEAYKPSDSFVAALRPHIGSPERTLFVGDNGVDVMTGQKLGTRTVHKSTDKSNPHEANFMITDLSQLSTLVDLQAHGGEQ